VWSYAFEFGSESAAETMYLQILQKKFSDDGLFA
jgi:hypothetical protein